MTKKYILLCFEFSIPASIVSANPVQVENIDFSGDIPVCKKHPHAQHRIIEIKDGIVFAGE